MVVRSETKSSAVQKHTHRRRIAKYWRRISKSIFDNWTLILLALPGVVLVILLRYIPMFGLVVAFQDFNLQDGFLSPWVGFKNFNLLWGSPILVRIVKNTLLLNGMFIIAETTFAVLIALLLNEVRSKYVRGSYQFVMFLPFFMGWALVAMVLYGLIDYEVGTVNMLLRSLGLERVAIRSKPEVWPMLLTIIRIWKETGAGCIIYLAVLIGVNPELYEAAAIDGAGRMQRMLYISLPTLVPTIITLVLIKIGHIFFADWGMIYALVGDSAILFPTTEVIDTYIIRALQSTVNFGMASATGLSQAVLSFILVLGANKLAKSRFGHGLF